ncbi:MAG: hypothetical protein IKL11_03255 [Muribaculaceae bacterium]|nr:hypothetical protein [Muribaculaceae bacterium]
MKYLAKTCLILHISSQNNNVLKHLTSRTNEGRVSSSLDLCRVQPNLDKANTQAVTYQPLNIKDYLK